MEVPDRPHMGFKFYWLAVAQIRRRFAIAHGKRHASIDIPRELQCELIATFVEYCRLNHATGDQDGFLGTCVDDGSRAGTVHDINEDPGENKGDQTACITHCSRVAPGEEGEQ